MALKKTPKGFADYTRVICAPFWRPPESCPMSAPDDTNDKPSSPGSQPISAPSRSPVRSKRRMPAATLDYGAAMTRLDVLLIDPDEGRGAAIRDELKRRGRSAAAVRSADDAVRVCEGMRPVVVLASLVGLSDEELEQVESVVRSPGGDKMALLSYVCGDQDVSAREGGPPLLEEPTPESLVDELAKRWPEPAF